MRKINYYVATSVDGYICGPGGDISGFVADGEGIQKYLEDLKSFDTVIMGKNTYEFGYKYGLKPGQPAYPHMEHFIFSNTMKLDDPHPQVHIEPISIEKIKALKAGEGSEIYLCGGGIMAGWLLDHELIDILTIKINPLVLGDGIRLFSSSFKKHQLKRTEHEFYSDGIEIIRFEILY